MSWINRVFLNIWNGEWAWVHCLVGILMLSAHSHAAPVHSTGPSIRVATYNTSLSRPEPGALKTALRGGQDAQARRVAEVIQRANPDILILQEFDWDAEGAGLKIFMDEYLSVPQNGADKQTFPHVFHPPVNTGVSTGLDLNGDGKTDGPEDAFGFGKHPGHYGFSILSKHPILFTKTRTFQTFKWADMPGAQLPKKPEQPGVSWYGDDAEKILRLSSKNHVDVTVSVDGQEFHLLVSHPTPPVFDGPENRNGLRNFDEIRFWADYLTPSKSSYHRDDSGQTGGLPATDPFIVLGDLNADPHDGDSQEGAIQQVLNHPRVHPDVAQGPSIPRSDGGRENQRRNGDKGDPAEDTASWGLRVDYVLPSTEFKVTGSGVFWPKKAEKLSRLVSTDKALMTSDHRLVWVNVVLESKSP